MGTIIWLLGTVLLLVGAIRSAWSFSALDESYHDRLKSTSSILECVILLPLFAILSWAMFFTSNVIVCLLIGIVFFLSYLYIAARYQKKLEKLDIPLTYLLRTKTDHRIFGVAFLLVCVGQALENL